MTPPDRYQPPTPFWRRLRFWSALIGETLTGRDVVRLARLRLQPGQPAVVEGRARLPRDGGFVLAINHFQSRRTLDVLAAVVLAVAASRPDLAERCVIVVGRRADRPRATRHPIARFLRRLNAFVRRRWTPHLLPIPWRNDTPSIGALRAWRRRLSEQPALVFPEGEPNLCFGQIRPGAGRWLATLPAPTLPVAVWWADGAWRVRFGGPVRWSHRAELHDLQIGLAIADLLPDDLTGGWRGNLARWRALHGRVVAGVAESTPE
jgi:1-acyl-sn-glycerol-3-phosphate acyltransferase